jgi:hypothetical protein
MKTAVKNASFTGTKNPPAGSIAIMRWPEGSWLISG